jgi:hypothetical protein
MKTTLVLALLALSLPSFGTVKIEEELFVIGQKPEILKELINSGSAIVDHVSHEGFELYGSIGLKDYLDSKSIPYMDMKEVNKVAFNDYPTHAEIGQKLMNAQAKNPGIIKVTSIGKSVKGKDLWMVKISDNVNSDEMEPEFKYISSMHGDEITGRELTVSLIEEIAAKYGKDSEITELVNNTELYIMPSMNPDGSLLRQRANANGVDLNRNFPDIISDSQSSMSGRAIENQAVMKFQAARQIALSANFHGGSQVVNYPWDSKYDRFPFDALVQELSTVYAELNPDLRNSSEFHGGITNGADWYVVRGGMQDWSYLWFNDLQVTIELSSTKWPSYSDIPTFYRNNRDSMIHFMKQVHRGAGFKISRAGVEGTVSIRAAAGRKDLGSYSFNSSQFYKVLPEGEYAFSVKEKSGATQSFNISVHKDSIKPNGNYVQLN